MFLLFLLLEFIHLNIHIKFIPGFVVIRHSIHIALEAFKLFVGLGLSLGLRLRGLFGLILRFGLVFLLLFFSGLFDLLRLLPIVKVVDVLSDVGSVVFYLLL